MRKPNPSPRVGKHRKCQNEYRPVLKIMNFEPKIQSNSSPSKSRYSSEEKIMRRRDMVQTFNSHIYREMARPQEERRARSSNDLRIENELFGEFHKAEMLNEQISSLSPVFKEKIAQLRNLASRKSALSKREEARDTQIHFTEYVMHSEYPSEPSVLHSRNKKDCPFMKSVKARHLMNRSADGRSKSQADQLFKSIELNSSSKYAVSRRIMLSGDNINNSFREAKTRGITSYGTKSFVEQRKSRMRKGHKALKLESADEYKPWETHVLDHGDDDPNIFHL